MYHKIILASFGSLLKKCLKEVERTAGLQKSVKKVYQIVLNGKKSDFIKLEKEIPSKVKTSFGVFNIHLLKLSMEITQFQEFIKKVKGKKYGWNKDIIITFHIIAK